MISWILRVRDRGQYHGLFSCGLLRPWGTFRVSHTQNFVFSLITGLWDRRQQKLGQMLSKLAHMAEEFNVAVLLVSLMRFVYIHMVLIANNRYRPIRFKAIQVLVLCLLEQMGKYLIKIRRGCYITN